MASQVQNESTMQYTHMSLQDRRDPNLDGNGSTPFHTNGLGQALSTHLTAGVGPAGPYNRSATDYRTTSPPTLTQPGSSTHAGATSSPLTFSAPGATSPAVKRKQIDSTMNITKRRRNDHNVTDDADNNTNFDMDASAQGAKHWTDDEKTRLFEWLMGPGQEEHWNALRATKNSCLRDCANQVFGGKKTYQALKGCYERNFNLFKQIYAFENAHGQGVANMTNWSDADRLREYERRLQIARKAGSDVGNITARTIDHWHRVGWYDLFYQRWHGDPATMRPVQTRNTTVMPNAMGVGGNDDPVPEDEDPTTIDFSDPTGLGGLNGVSHDRQHVYISDLPPPPVGPQQSTSAGGMRPPAPPQPPHAPQPPPPSLGTTHPQPGQPHLTSGTATPADGTVFTFSVTQDMLTRCLHYLNVQTKIAQERLEIMRRREAREISEWNARKEAEKFSMAKDKTARAFELINNKNADPALRQVASEYIRKILQLD